MERENSKEEIIGEDEWTIPFEENNKDKDANMTRIGNQIYDRDTLNRITIVQITQIGLPQIEIRIFLKVSKALISKWANYDKRAHKKIGWIDLKNSMKRKKILFTRHLKEN